MPINAEALKTLIEDELKSVRDDRVLALVRELLVEPHPEFYDWAYGDPGQQYPCWIVLDHPDSGSCIAYCEHGFGPSQPWGLLHAKRSDTTNHLMGQDSGWSRHFLEAFFESVASIPLNIWRVFKVDDGWPGCPVTDETSWDGAWAQCYALQGGKPGPAYVVRQSIVEFPTS